MPTHWIISWANSMKRWGWKLYCGYKKLHTRWSFSCHCATILDYYKLIAGESKYISNSIKSDLPRAFQQHPEHSQIPIQFSILILFSFHWESGSISNSFHTLVPDSLKPSWCTATHLELSQDTKSTAWKQWVGRSQCDKRSKTNYLASLIDASILKIHLGHRKGQGKNLGQNISS
jgi:hypothetical protein